MPRTKQPAFFRLSPATYERLRELMESRDRTATWVVEKAIERFHAQELGQGDSGPSSPERAPDQEQQAESGTSGQSPPTPDVGGWHYDEAVAPSTERRTDEELREIVRSLGRREKELYYALVELGFAGAEAIEILPRIPTESVSLRRFADWRKQYTEGTSGEPSPAPSAAPSQATEAQVPQVTLVFHIRPGRQPETEPSAQAETGAPSR